MFDPNDQSTWTRGDKELDMFLTPQCFQCARYQGDARCPAFSGKIPMDILDNSHDHRQPFEGDGGLLFVSRDSIKTA